MGLDDEDLKFSLDDIKCFKKYIALSLMRSPANVKIFSKELLIDINRPQDMMLMAYNANPMLVDSIFENAKMNIILNKTNFGFVIPQNCFYTISKDGCVMIVAPISPFAALVLNFDERLKDNFTDYGTIYDLGLLDVFNHAAFKYEFKENRQCVYAKEEKDLTRYKEYINQLIIKR